MNKLISIIVPVYNNDIYLNKCIDSILKQTYRNIEIILINDGSTDNSGKICEEYVAKDDSIKIIHQQNKGVSVARNNGLAIAKGEYIGFVDGDDYIKEDMFEYLLNLLEQNSADISMCNYYSFDDNKISVKNVFKKDLIVLSSNNALEMIFTSLAFSCWNKLFKRKLFENELFETDISMGEDLYIIFKLFCKSKNIVVGNEIKYYYNRINTKSSTKQEFNIGKLSFFKVISYILDYANSTNNKKLYREALKSRTYHAIGFLRQIIDSNFNNIEIINDLRFKIKEGIIYHILSNYKLTNKLFAVCVIVKFKYAKFLYRFIGQLRKKLGF
jgi:glycosyltransferase involved in cell wall biosynthesis